MMKPRPIEFKIVLFMCLLSTITIETRSRRSSRCQSDGPKYFQRPDQLLLWRRNNESELICNNETHKGARPTRMVSVVVDEDTLAMQKNIQFGIDPIFKVAQNYLDEHRTQFDQVMNHDDSIDQRLANLIYSIHHRGVINLNYFEFNSGDQRQDVRNERLVAGPKVNDQLCGKHLNQMIKLMDEMEAELELRRNSNHFKNTELPEKYLRLARALESFGHYDSGYLSGKTHSFGSYNQCLNTKLNLGDSKLIKTRYCWAKLNLEEFLLPAFKSTNARYHLTTAICLPETCHTRSFKLYNKQIQKLVDGEFQLPQSVYLRKNLKVDSIFCTADGDSDIKIPNNGRVLLILLAGWFVLAILGTVLRRQVREMDAQGSLARRRLQWVLTCLDLKKSWQEFVGVDSSSSSLSYLANQQPNPTSGIETTTTAAARRVDLDTLNPVRCAGCAFVIWGHALLLRAGFGMDQTHLPSIMEVRPFGGFVIVGTVVVDTFFAISGIITCYLVMKKASKKPDTRANLNDQPRRQTSSLNKFFSSLYLIIKTRYLRLFPMLIVFYWFKRSVFIYLGSGPFWDFGFNVETLNGACLKESWLVPLTFMSAFKPLSKQCLMQSWSISNDMFFTVIFAPLILLMTKKPKLAASIAVVYCLVSLQALLKAIRALDPGDRQPIEDLTAQGFGTLFSRSSHIYSYPIYRVTSYVIGMFAGYFLHHYNESKSIKQWPGWFRGPATKLSLIYIGCLFAILSNGGVLKPFVDPYHRLAFPYFMTIGKSIWAATNCVVFLRMMTDWNDTFWMRASKSKFWQALSKINYVMLLLHFDLLIFDATATPQGNLNNLWAIFQAFATVYIISLLLSIVIFVALENPLDKLIKQLVFVREKRVECLKKSA